MSKLNLMDKIASCYAKAEEMPIKGHAKIILTDARDGTQKIIESDNMVTNAVASLYSKNWSRLADFSSSNIQPIRNLFSGVMCFQNEITENADNFDPPADDINPMIAHAGDAPNDTASTLRGSPVPADFEITDTSIKQVWFWPTTAGNGTIRNVSLCPGSVMGNMGLKPFNDEFNPLSTFGNDSVSNNSWNEEISKQYPFNISDDGQTSWSVWLDDTTFKEYTMRHDYFKFGIMRGTRDWQDVANRSATVRGGANRFIFDDANFYYIARATSATSMQIDKVNKTTFEVTQADCTFSGVSLWTGNIQGGKNVAMRIFGFDGTYLYYPNSNGNQFLKLNISDNSDVIVLDGELNIEKGQIAEAQNGWQFMSPLAISTGLVLGSNYIINGARTYPIAHCRAIGGANTYLAYAHWLWTVKKGAATYGNAKQTYGSSSSQWTGQSNILNQMFLSTINNIDQVVKSTSQTMSIIYTLREAT